ncbi:diacylglycerol kinase [Candidatus Azambacteria bacterium]|nr:diacylglycerol kinase [Candidatus Azambacteria bacterium]
MKKIAKSFKHAFHGLYDAFLGEHNFRVMALLVAGSFLFGFFYIEHAWEVAALIISGAFMLFVEMINTAIEKSLDLWTTQKHDKIRFVKDVMSGAALVASLAWLFIIVLIFFY